MTDPGRCLYCVRPARMALHTTCPSYDRIQTVVFYDHRAAPATALRYCHEHGADAIADLVKTLVAADEPTVKEAK
jgi:hypothetical protein